jgi:hypothetical protein
VKERRWFWLRKSDLYMAKWAENWRWRNLGIYMALEKDLLYGIPVRCLWFWTHLDFSFSSYRWRWLRVIAPLRSGKYPRKRLQGLWRLAYPRLLETILASLMTEYQVVGR